ncbi:ABC transporter ATP-binding protein [Alkaliphilus oremlandii]|uniref:ABC transporter related n=1 Tax=Alkaliphilus oremlandii (strain OhILAs) TaxID=350688 RepID=A8MK15_ALKOO|nr:ABC transporter ATP-binding protein [Alkaliphilus oremlandii]ABW20147.1 ABC transporter related [Alkaliphilus oremlandii OhILAs]
MALLEITDVARSYKDGQVSVQALKGVTISIEDGEFVSIMGPSGSGKSTLMNIIGCLDKPTAGTYSLANQQVQKMNDWQLANIRNEFMGFVFQQFHLISKLNALENVELPLIYQGVIGKERKQRAKEALEAVGLGERIKHMPSQLSGGEQQRVAIARAIVSNPRLILADEPTGALDSKASKNIMEIFQQLNKERKITIVQVTHERNIGEYGKRIYHLKDGLIDYIEEIQRTELENNA